MRVVLVALVCSIGLLAAQAAGAPASAAVPTGCSKVRAHAGRTSKDWEAVFGTRRRLATARVLLRTVRRKGFRCAVIEHERHLYEVSVIGLHTRGAALRITVRAHRARLKAHVEQS
jgi:hypothetical protein